MCYKTKRFQRGVANQLYGKTVRISDTANKSICNLTQSGELHVTHGLFPTTHF